MFYTVLHHKNISGCCSFIFGCREKNNNFTFEFQTSWCFLQICVLLFLHVFQDVNIIFFLVIFVVRYILGRVLIYLWTSVHAFSHVFCITILFSTTWFWRWIVIYFFVMMNDLRSCKNVCFWVHSYWQTLFYSWGIVSIWNMFM